MKNLVLILSFSVFSQILCSQEIVLRFEPADGASVIDSIKITAPATSQVSVKEGAEITLPDETTSVNILENRLLNGMVYPNPFWGETELHFTTSSEEDVTIIITNTAGQVILSQQKRLQPGMNQLQLSVKSQGMYFITIAGKEKTISYKAVSLRSRGNEDRITLQGTSPVEITEKSAKVEEGKLYHFEIYSGENITVIADSPTESKTYEVEFHECKDADGRNYKIVQIGEQLWMAENMAYLPKVTPSSHEAWDFPDYSVFGYEGTSVKEAKESPNFDTYGVYYNWFAALQSCPKGWHLPTDVEWAQLAEFISQDNGGYTVNEGTWTNIGGHLKTLSGWENEKNGTDDYGFSAIPAGMSTYYGGLQAVNQMALFWTADGESRLDRGNISYIPPGVNDLTNLLGAEGHIGGSARYIMGVSKPISYTRFASGVEESKATLNALILSDNGSQIIEKGFYFAESGMELMQNGNKIVIEGTTLDYNFVKDNLSPGKNYQYCAFSANSIGFSLGDTLTFRTTAINIEYETFVDPRDNYEYKTVQLGNQIWMAENLKFDAGEGCWAYSNSDNLTKYGRLYNWVTAKSACPDGWHLPTNDEWQRLVLHVASSMNYDDKNFLVWTETEGIGNHLKSKTGWMESGNGTDDFGFSALPGGRFYKTEEFDGIGYSGKWWSRTGGIDPGEAWSWGLDNYNNLTHPDRRSDILIGYSVRCVKDKMTTW